MTDLLSNYFKVNDNVVYKPNWKFSQKEKGTVLEANVKSPSNIGRKIGCIVKMDSGRTQWYSEDTLTLDRQLKTEENQENQAPESGNRTILSTQFKVNDTVRYTGIVSPSNKSWNKNGTIFEVDTDHITSCGVKEICYSIKWEDGSTNCMYLKDGLELVKSTANSEFTVKCAKELKSELENVIHNLIQDFNKKTNLQIKDIDLDRERTLGGDCLYRINVKVEI